MTYPDIFIFFIEIWYVFVLMTDVCFAFIHVKLNLIEGIIHNDFILP